LLFIQIINLKNLQNKYEKIFILAKNNMPFLELFINSIFLLGEKYCGTKIIITKKEHMNIPRNNIREKTSAKFKDFKFIHKFPISPGNYGATCNNL